MILSTTVLRGLGFALLAVAMAWSGTSAGAQDGNWWEGITSFGAPDYSGKRASLERSQPRKDDLNDLRPNDVPWRSDEMLAAMENAIARYEQIVNKGGWPTIPGNRMLRPGDSDERVSYLRRRLMVTGELPRSSSYNDYEYDSAVEQAVARYQENNGLRTNGRVDQPTLAALNVTAQERLAQLKLNHGRILELVQQPTEERYVLVNIPAFQLEAVERYQTMLRHRVIVGRNGRETPTLKATIKNLNFFPYWRVPDSVAQLDLIPRLRKEPQYLDQEKIRVFATNGLQEIDHQNIDWNQADATKIKFKQDPGPQNALGLVRIDMSNPEGVYMHDTPMKNLFDQSGRAFSAGCVRVQGVFKLAEWIARYEVGWDQPGRVEDVLQSGQALDLNLSHPIPVYFTYITAWAEPNGLIEFRPDLYGRDGGREFLAGGEREPGEGPTPQQERALAP